MSSPLRPFQPVFLRSLILPLAALALVAAVDEAGPIETIVVRGAYFGQALASKHRRFF